MKYERCARCRQLIDPSNPDELVHHARMGHRPMPGIPDDGLETIPLDFAGVGPRLPEDEPRGPSRPQQAPAPYKNARRGRRRRSDFA